MTHLHREGCTPTECVKECPLGATIVCDKCSRKESGLLP
jgi:hypothetical protein